jgi:hypothetical protein
MNRHDLFSDVLPKIETLALLVAIGGIVLKLLKLPMSSYLLLVGMGSLSLISVIEFSRPSYVFTTFMKILVRAMPLVRAICQLATLLVLLEIPFGSKLVVQGSLTGFAVVVLFYLQPDKSGVPPREFEKTLGAVGLALFIFLGLK